MKRNIPRLAMLNILDKLAFSQPYPAIVEVQELQEQQSPAEIFELYGAHFFDDGETAINTQRRGDLYAYTCYVGKHEIKVEDGDSIIFIGAQHQYAYWWAGECEINSAHFAVVLRGYSCGVKQELLHQNVNLPYVNGCATKQIFHPQRIGDPTLQQLTIPPYTSEQKHHIHPTVRAVYVLSGSGYSIVGQNGHTAETPLKAGMVCILDPMTPHHFRTEGEYLTVLPVHVFSSTASDENHPMFNGTKEV